MKKKIKKSEKKISANLWWFQETFFFLHFFCLRSTCTVRHLFHAVRIELRWGLVHHCTFDALDFVPLWPNSNIVFHDHDHDSNRFCTRNCEVWQMMRLTCWVIFYPAILQTKRFCKYKRNDKQALMFSIVGDIIICHVCAFLYDPSHYF